MKIDLSKLSYDDSRIIDETVTIDSSYYANTDIRGLSDVKVLGNIDYNDDSTFSLKLNVTGEMILPCTVSLEEVEYPFNIEIDEIIDPNDKENDDYVKIIDNTLDIMPIVWQNIVVEIPLRVVSPNLDNVKLEGDGWKLLTEEEKMKELDPRLEKLRDLLDN